MNKILKTVGSVIMIIAVTLSLTVSSYADFSPAQKNDFAYNIPVIGPGSGSNYFNVTSAGNVTITGQVYFVLPPHTPSQTVSAYVYIYDASGYQVLSLWLDTSIRANDTDNALTSLTYTNSRTIYLPVGTYTIVASTSCTSYDISSYYTVIAA